MQIQLLPESMEPMGMTICFLEILCCCFCGFFFFYPLFMSAVSVGLSQVDSFPLNIPNAFSCTLMGIFTKLQQGEDTEFELTF